MIRYSGEEQNECKRLFVEDELSPRLIADKMNGKPSFQTIVRWAKKKAKDGKSWYDLREDKINNQYEALSPKSQISKIYKRIDAILSDETFDVKSADQLSKLSRYMKDIVDPQYQVHIMYELLTDFVAYLRDHESDLLSNRFLSVVRDFKNHLRSRLGQ